MGYSVKFSLSFAARILVYVGIMFLLNAIFMYDAQNTTDTGKFGEISITEFTQEVFIFLSGVLFIFIGRNNRDLTPIANLISIFFFMSFIREFNNYIPFWFYLVLPFMVLFFYLIYRDRKKIFASAQKFLEIPYTAYFVTGFLITFVFSRLFGRSKFWEALLETDYNRWAKNAAEEGIELLGYTFFFIASVEIFLAVIRKRKQTEKA
jgi:hypothetical protein